MSDEARSTGFCFYFQETLLVCCLYACSWKKRLARVAGDDSCVPSNVFVLECTACAVFFNDHLPQPPSGTHISLFIALHFFLLKK